MAKRPTSERRPPGTRTLKEIQTRRAFSGLSKTRLRQVLAPAETGKHWKQTERGTLVGLYDAELVDLIARTVGRRDPTAAPESKRGRRRKAPPLRKGEQWFSATDLQRAALAQFAVGLEPWHIRSQLDRHAERVLPRHDFGDGLGTKYASERATRCLRHSRPRARVPYAPYLTSRIRAARTELIQVATDLGVDRGLREDLAHEFDRLVREESSALDKLWDRQAPAGTVRRIDELVDRSLADFVARVREASKKGTLESVVRSGSVEPVPQKPAKKKAAKTKARRGAKRGKAERESRRLAALLAAELDAAPEPLLETITGLMLSREVWDYATVAAAPQQAARELQSWFGDIAEGSDPRTPPRSIFVEAIVRALLPNAPADAISQDELSRFVVMQIRTRAWAFDCLWHGLATERRAVERFLSRDLPRIHAGLILNQLSIPLDAKLSLHESGLVTDQIRERIRQRLEAGEPVPDVAAVQDEFDLLSRSSSSTLKRREARKKR